MTLNQKQCEAFADILVLAMCMDGHFSLLEEEEIQQAIDNIGWDQSLSRSLHINASIARARDVAASPDAVRAHLEVLAPAISEPVVANFIVEETNKVLHSDGLSTDEGTFIAQLKAVLKV